MNTIGYICLNSQFGATHSYALFLFINMEKNNDVVVVDVDDDGATYYIQIFKEFTIFAIKRTMPLSHNKEVVKEK